MRTRLLTLSLLALSAAASAQMKGGDDITGPYDVVAGWPADVCGDGWQIGSTGGVWAEHADRIYVLQRGCLPELPPSNQIVPGRNASGYSFSASDPERHPRRGLHLMIFNRDGELIDNVQFLKQGTDTFLLGILGIVGGILITVESDNPSRPMFGTGEDLNQG